MTPPELRDSPSSSNFDPAVGDTVANRSNDTAPRPTPPIVIPKSGSAARRTASKRGTAKRPPAARSSSPTKNRSSGSSLFGSDILKDDPASMDLLPDDSSPSLPLSAPSLKIEPEKRMVAETKRRTSKVAGPMERLLNSTYFGVPALIWISIVAIFLLIAILFGFLSQTNIVGQGSGKFPVQQVAAISVSPALKTGLGA